MVNFSPSLAGVPVVLTAGEIQLNKVTVLGSGANEITISGNNASRIFFIASGAGATIVGVTLTGGNGVGAGSQPGGGAIRAEGALTLISTHLTGNSLATGEGSGVFYAGGGVIRNSTFSNNSGTAVSALQSLAISAQNSTITGSGSFDMHFIGTNVSIRNCTFTGRTLIGGLSGLQSGNSIIGTVTRASMLSGFNSLGNNIIISPDTTGNQIIYHGTDKLNMNPQLEFLGYYGGHIQLLALSPSSPAIDAGSNTIAVNAGLATDQRLYARIVDGDDKDTIATVDIGAYEANAAPVSPIIFGGRVIDTASNGVGRATVRITDSEGFSQTVITSPFGFYNFTNVHAGNILVEVSAKRHRYNPTVLFATENTTNADLMVN